MKLLEEETLSKVVKKVKQYQNKNNTPLLFYENIATLNIDSLQVNSIKMNLDYLKEVSFILSVIMSITYKPLIITTTEDLIVRSDQAGSLSNEDFQMVLRDPSLWKKKNHEVLPEYVHHRQYTDEIRTYENIFVGMLIQLLSKEVTSYLGFYSKLIPSLNDKLILNDDESIESVMNILLDLQKKIRLVKDSYFYKEITKANLKLTKIHPTNILTKNKLYNHCYKFYRKFIKYNDLESIGYDYRLYNYVHILKYLLSNEYKCIECEDYYNYKFEGKDFNINLISNSISSIILEISKYDVTAKHILYLNANDEEFSENNYYDTNEELTIWNLKELDTNNLVFPNYVKEKQMIKKWLDDKLVITPTNKRLYSRYCPSCKSQDINSNITTIECSNCHSIYTFIKENEEDKIWFIKLRRR